MSSLYIFNPENDLALADGCRNYYPPPAARKIAGDLAMLPIWYAVDDSHVVVPKFTDGAYINDVSAQFGIKAQILQPTEVRAHETIASCVPWGWSPYISKRFTDMGVDAGILPPSEAIALYRDLSNRKTTAAILTSLSQAGIDVPEPLPCYTSSLAEAMRFVETNRRSILKAPWSGSGRGLVWGRGIYERSVEQLCRGIINRQGGIICEKALDKVLDFAMEFRADGENVEFAGYSLFCTDEKGAYRGNMLASDTFIEELLSRYVGQETLVMLKQVLPEILQKLFGGKYKGVCGIDMMIYRDGSICRIAPCIELNLRMSMGALARIFYDRYVKDGVLGRLDILYFGKPGEAESYCRDMVSKYPPSISSGKLVAGAVLLAPVCGDTGYAAVARCGLAESEFQEFPV